MMIDNGMDYDVVIVGAGVNGLMMAGLLTRTEMLTPVRVAILEAQADKTLAIDHYDPKLLALTPATKTLLQRIGVYDQIPREAIACFRAMHVWHAYDDAGFQLTPETVAEPALAYTIGSDRLKQVMHQVISATAGLEMMQPVCVTELTSIENKQTITLEDGRRLTAELVIAADGGRSKIRELAQIEVDSKAYQQKAITAVIKTEQPHNGIARQRFLEDGVLAFLPMHNANETAIVWSTQENHAAHLEKLEDQAFQDALTEASAAVLGRVISAGARQSYPLVSQQALNYIKPGLALIGDAAHTVHPLAGQGANLGFLDAAVLAEHIKKAMQRGCSPGELSVLRKYERWRKGENALMMNAFSGLKWLFGKSQTPIPELRSIGMKLFNQCKPLQEIAIRRAMGLSGDLPEILN